MNAPTSELVDQDIGPGPWKKPEKDDPEVPDNISKDDKEDDPK